MKMTLLSFALILLLAGCDNNQPTAIVRDQCLRVKLFQQCLQLVPAGPKITNKSDWAAVVNACSSAADYQSFRPRMAVDPKCITEF